MSERTKVVKLLSSDKPLADVLVKGWVRTRRDAKDFSFIEVNDGSCLKNIQVIAGQRSSQLRGRQKTDHRFFGCRQRRAGSLSGRQPEI